MPGRIKQGQSVFISFKGGESIYDSQNKARMYISEEKFRASFPRWRFGDVDLVEYVPKYSEADPKWISVEERLPDEEQTVLIVCKNGARFVGFYRFDYEGEVQWKIWTALGSARKLNKGRVTHWMPLPEPPKEEV